MYSVAVRERSAAHAIALGPWAMSRARALNAPVLCASVVSGPCVLLGATQRAARVLELPRCAREGITVLRRESTGQAAWIQNRGLIFSLGLPHVAALVPDAREGTLVNRNVRMFLRGFTRAGAPSSYLGRDYVSVGRRPFALLGFEVRRDGAVLLEVIAGIDSSFALPDRILTDAERALARWWDRSPLCLGESRPGLDPARFAETLRGLSSSQVTLDEPELQPVFEARDTHFGRALCAPSVKLVPMGIIEAMKVERSDNTHGIFLGGDALAPTWLYQDLALGILPQGEIALMGARIEDLVDVVNAAKR